MKNKDIGRAMMEETERIKGEFIRAYENLPVSMQRNKVIKELKEGISDLARLIKTFEPHDQGIATLLFGVLVAIAAGPKAISFLIDIQIEGMVKHMTEGTLPGTKREKLNLFDSIDATKPVSLSKL